MSAITGSHSASHATRSPSWTRTDYLLRGEFCPPSAIAERLELVRRQSGADIALLLVAGEQALLRSLSMAAADDERAAQLTGVLRTKGLRPRGQLRPPTHFARGRSEFPDTAENLLLRLAKNVGKAGLDGQHLVGDPAT